MPQQQLAVSQSDFRGKSWYKVPIDTEWNNFIDGIGENGGGTFVAGWRYTSPISSGDYSEVDGATNDNPPKIKVVYDKP